MFGKLTRENGSSVKNSLISNAFFSSLGWFLPLVLGFIATPLILKKLGYEDYGLFSLILGFISYSFTFGIGRAVTKYVAEYRAENKNAEVSEIISATLWFSIVLGAAATLLIVSCADYIVADILQIEMQKRADARIGLYLACATIGFLMIGQVFQAIIQALHRFDRNSLLININGVLLTAGNIGLVYAGFGLKALLAWNLAATVINCALFYHSAKQILPEFQIRLKISNGIAKLVFQYGLGIIGYQIFGNFLLIFERGWITRNLGAENLAFYVVPMSLAIYLHGLISSLILVVFPVFSELRDNRERLLNLYLKATKIIFALIVFFATNLICASRLFLEIWIGGEMSENAYPLLIVHTLTFSLIAALSVMWQLAEGLGHPRYNAVLSFIWLVIAIPLMIWLVEPLANLGVALSRCAGVLITFPLLFYGEKLFFGAVQWRFWGKLLLTMTAAAIVTAFIEYQIFWRFEPNILTLLIGGMCGTACYGLILWKGNLFENEKIIASIKNFRKQA